MSETKEKWHADKRVPLALIVTILVQTAGIVWWAATTDSRVGVLETWMKDNKTITTDLAVVKTNQTYIKDALDEIKDKLK